MSGPLTKADVEKLLWYMPGNCAIRDRAYTALLYGCGLRNNECRMLDLSDLNREDELWTIRVRYPKNVRRGASKRSIGIPSLQRTLLGIWINKRGERPGPLFTTGHGRRMDTSHMRRKMKLAAEAAGIDPAKIHPHALRHTFARELHDEDVSMRIIQLALGHASLNTTARYLQGLGDPEVIAVTSRR